MVSDASLVVQALLARSRAPRVIIYGIAPRDFQDNCMPKLGQSPLFQVIPESTTSYDLGRFKGSLADSLEYFIGKISDFYHSRRKYRDVAVGLFSNWSNHPQTLFASSTGAASNRSGEASLPVIGSSCVVNSPGKVLSKADDLSTYRSRYSPVNVERLKAEQQYFAKIVRSCAARGTRLIIVPMPLTDENVRLIPTTLHEGYISSLNLVKGSPNTSLVDMSNEDIFSPGDFSDSAHLNETGSKKFQEILADKTKPLIFQYLVHKDD